MSAGGNAEWNIVGRFADASADVHPVCLFVCEWLLQQHRGGWLLAGPVERWHFGSFAVRQGLVLRHEQRLGLLLPAAALSRALASWLAR